MKPDTPNQAGFTLVELMMTLAIAALLIGLAAPSFRDLAIRNRVSTYANELISTINVARSEAVRRGTDVTICSSNNGNTCAGLWSNGWIVFVDRNGDAARDADEGAEEVLVKSFESLANLYSLGASDTIGTTLTYRPDGSAASTGVFAVCHDGQVVGARAVVVTLLRPRMARDADGDRIPNVDSGDDIADCDSP